VSIFLTQDRAGTKLDEGSNPGVERQVPGSLRRTKIVATLGPATSEATVLRSLILAGAEVLRLNFSHGTHAEKQAQIESARRIGAELDRPVAILQDLQGPKIRLGRLEDVVHLKKGERIKLRGDGGSRHPNELSVSYPRLTEVLHASDLIFIDDGLIELRVTGVSDAVEAEVVVGGPVTERKGVARRPRSRVA